MTLVKVSKYRKQIMLKLCKNSIKLVLLWFIFCFDHFLRPGQKNVICFQDLLTFSLNIHNNKNYGPLFSLRNIKYVKKMLKNLDSCDSGPILDNWKNNPWIPITVLNYTAIKINRVKCLKINHSLATQHKVYMPYIAHLHIVP